MNIYRLCGDMLHLLSIIVRLHRIWVVRDAKGLSLRTQELFLLVFVTRYLDLVGLFYSWYNSFIVFYSWYNSFMKILYIGSTSSLVYAIRYQETIKATYDDSKDTFLHWKFGVVPCFVLAFVTHLIGTGVKDFDVIELLWTFSIYLEPIAILPQLIVLQRCREVMTSIQGYVYLIGAYRGFYILNWIYRASIEYHYRHHWVTYICAVIQTLLCANVFYYCIQRSIPRVDSAPILLDDVEITAQVESSPFLSDDGTGGEEVSVQAESTPFLPEEGTCQEEETVQDGSTPVLPHDGTSEQITKEQAVESTPSSTMMIV